MIEIRLPASVTQKEFDAVKAKFEEEFHWSGLTERPIVARSQGDEFSIGSLEGREDVMQLTNVMFDVLSALERFR